MLTEPRTHWHYAVTTAKGTEVSQRYRGWGEVRDAASDLEPSVDYVIYECWKLECEEQTMAIEGVGPDAPVVENENGAKQSQKKWRFDLVDPRAMFVLGRILDYGAAKYGEENWRGLSVTEHLNSALMHIHAYLAKDYSDDHLGHAFCRTMMALAVALEQGYAAKQADER